MAIESFAVPTKTHSGSAPSAPAGSGFDAFSHYSDDATRMRALRTPTAALDAPRASNAAPERIGARPRKTKISFELHPSLFFEDLFLEDLPSDDSLGEDHAQKIPRFCLDFAT